MTLSSDWDNRSCLGFFWSTFGENKQAISESNLWSYRRELSCCRKDTEITYNDAFLYASGIVGLNALNALLLNHIYHLAFHNGMKVRVAVCSVIYRKALRLSQTALGETSTGKMVNLLSNDVNRFDWASFFINSLWVSPLLTLIVGCLMWIEIGFVGLIGIFVVFMIVPILSMWCCY